jgi:hypothetical protein
VLAPYYNPPAAIKGNVFRLRALFFTYFSWLLDVVSSGGWGFIQLIASIHAIEYWECNWQNKCVKTYLY